MVTIHSTEVYVGNLHRCTNVSKLRTRFEPFGEILEASIEYDQWTGGSLQHGRVEFVRQQDAELAIVALNGAFFDCKPLLVCWYGDCTSRLHHFQRTLVIRNVPRTVRCRQVRARVRRFGRVLQCHRLTKCHTTKSVEFLVLFDASYMARNAAEELQEQKWKQNTIRTSVLNVWRDGNLLQSVDHWARSNTMYVDHLRPDVRALELLALFSQYGKVRRVKILRPDGVPSYGVVQFASATELQRVIKHRSIFVIKGYRIRGSAFRDLEMPTELMCRFPGR